MKLKANLHIRVEPMLMIEDRFMVLWQATDGGLCRWLLV